MRLAKPGTTHVPLARLVAAISPGRIAPVHDGPGALGFWLPRGRWTPPVTLRRTDLTLFVMSGSLLLRRASGADLLLENELCQAGLDPDDAWKVLSPQPALVAVLTITTVADMARIPGAAHALLLALHAQHERSVELRSIVCVYDVQERILRFFAHLADRIGRSEGAAVRIPLLLEQKRIEELLGAGHTQSTTAFRSLVRAGALVHDAAGWLFDPSAGGLASSVPNLVPARTDSVPNPIPSEPAPGLPVTAVDP